MPEYVNKGDVLRGDKIAISARRIESARVMARTSAHQGQFATLRDNAYCTIEVPFKWVLEKNEGKRKRR